MPRVYTERNLITFQQSFPDSAACEKHLAAQRWADGFLCPACKHTKAWYLSDRQLFVCSNCRTQTSLTSGTIFHGTKVPLIKWYWLIYHMAMAKVGVSIAEMQRILGIGQYKTAWLMAHKVREAMIARDSRYSLAGLVEMDESFFGPRGATHGRGSETKCTVLCAVSLYRNKAGEQKPGFAHMSVVNDASAATIGDFLDRLGCGETTEDGKALMKAIRTDGWRSYGPVAKDRGLRHFKVVLKDPKAAGKLMPWVHRVISNTKAVIRGTHRGVSNKHLQRYLSEIAYRFNRRYWEPELFDRLVQACLTAETVTYKELTKSV